MTGRERILIRGVNWLGDAVMSTPALLRLREAKPTAHIALLSHAKLSGLWHHHPALDDVIHFEEKDGLLGIARKLRAEKFSAALLFPNSPRAALEAFLAGIPSRAGLARPWRNAFLTQRISPRPGVVTMRKRTPGEIRRLVSSRFSTPSGFLPESSHQMHHYLHLTAVLGAKPEALPPQIEVSEAEVSALQKRFGGAKESGRPLFGLNPGAEYGPAKRWPRERFISVAIELQKRTNCRWWILGGKSDQPLATAIQKEIQAANTSASDSVQSLAGQTSLRELCAALKSCDVVLTNDTGPMHLAAAVGTRVVVPFGSTSPELTGPGLPGNPQHGIIKAQVPCSPCFRRECPIDFRCMTSITEQSIVLAVLQAIQKN